jgi:hypothetical protein
MQHVLIFLHTALRACPFGIELAVVALLFLGWIFAQTQMEYAAMLGRACGGTTLIATVCGSAALLLLLVVLADILSFRIYVKLLPIGGLMVILLVVSAVSQRLGHAAARRHLVTEGY